MDLSKIGLRPNKRYWYHPESDSYFTTTLSEPVPYEGQVDELTRADYERRVADAAAAKVESSPAPEVADESVGMATESQDGMAPDSGSGTSLVLASSQQVVAPEPPPTSGPAGFRAVLDYLDELIGTTTQIQLIQMDAARSHVKTIMQQLVSNPEYDEILVDKDVHNVMVFVQSSVTMAQAGFVQKKQTKEKKEAKKSKYGNMTFDENILLGIAGPDGKVADDPWAALDAVAASILPKDKK